MTPNTLAIGSDARTNLTDAVIHHLHSGGYELQLSGALTEDDPNWPVVGRNVAEKVVAGLVGQAILFCWTGTGVTMAANKVPGARAALCGDAETARGARRWNDANILCLSLRATTTTVATEIIDAWLDTEPDDSERENIDLLKSMDT